MTVAAPTGTVARVLEIMRALASASGGASVAEVAKQVGLPRPTVHRLLGILVAEGVAHLDEHSHRYEPGIDFVRMGAAVANRFPLSELAAPTMRQLVAETGESCLLGVPLPNPCQMMFLAHEASTHPLGYRVELMSVLPVSWGASGKAILAFLPPKAIEAVLGELGPSPVTGRTVTPGVLRRQLADIRARGYAYSQGEKIPGSRGIAGPVFRADGTVCASLCLTVPEMRFSEGAIGTLSELIIKGSQELSGFLGYRA